MNLKSYYFVEGADVYDFHRKFMVPMASGPSFLDQATFEFRKKFLQEELNEFIQGHTTGDMHLAADSLIDLVYVALGTALMMGLPWCQLWDKVQDANMAKERAKDDGSNSKRGSPLDVIKPDGWQAPDHTGALGVGPWPVYNITDIAAEIAARLKEKANRPPCKGANCGRNDGTHSDECLAEQDEAMGHEEIHHLHLEEPPLVNMDAAVAELQAAGVVVDQHGNIVGTTTVETRPDGTKHYVASLDPAKFNTRS
jgi:predicted HAD superfamily Cof-like phosphohydrolase